MKIVIIVDILVIVFNIIYFTSTFRRSTDLTIKSDPIDPIEFSMNTTEDSTSIEETEDEKETEVILEDANVRIYREVEKKISTDSNTDIATVSDTNVEEHTTEVEESTTEVEETTEAEETTEVTKIEESNTKKQPPVIVLPQAFEGLYNMNPPKMYSQLESENPEFNYIYGKQDAYTKLLYLITTHTDFKSNYLCTYFRDGNKSIVIGDSLPLGLGIYYDTLQFDLIALKSSRLENCYNWLKQLDKQYDNIFIWSGTNNFRDGKHKEALDDVVYEALNHISNNGKIRIIANGYVRDEYTYSYLYNTYVTEQLDKIKAICDNNEFVVPIYDILQRTKNNSRDCIHYNGKEQYNTIKDKIVNIIADSYL